jgi:IS605 OrfB family transposase
MMQRTYETRLPADPDRDALLGAYAELYGRVQRTLFARLCAGEPLAALKRVFLVRFGLTGRQFNALAAEVQGQIASITHRRSGLIATLERRIVRARKVLTKLPRGTAKYHQKRRRLGILEQRLTALRADAASGRVRLCFGSRKLFRRQFALTENGYASHDKWRRDWRAARSSQFFVLGSKDETAGCQGCVATVETDGSMTLRLRLPNALAARGKHVLLPGLRFRYGHDAVVAAIGRTLSPNTEDRQAIAWRFVRDRRGWRVLATVSVPPGERRSVDGIGVVVAYALERRKPIAAERLDFEKKKAEREQRDARYARMLSDFAYATFHAMLSARCYDAGIALTRVNPAYTSAIGAYKFADRYGLSRHQAAACSIGRRGMRLAERANRRMGAQVAFPLPVRNRGKHVWAFWREVARRAAAHAARGRRDPTVRSSPAARTARRAIRSSAAGGTPARESSAALFG